MNNQKIAEWAGFTHKNWAKKAWRFPDRTRHDNLPDFPNDLNACEKWIWPKLDSVDLFISEGKATATIRKGEPLEASSWYLGEHTIPATAVCLAIEKLIDEVKQIKSIV